MGHPAAVGEPEKPREMYTSAPVAHDAYDGPASPMEGSMNNPSAGTDSAVRAAGATGSMEVTRDAPVSIDCSVASR
jgi:hypothetical protein